MALTFSTLALGTRQDAGQFKSKCESDLSGTSQSHVAESEPSVDEIKAFFATSPEWVYLAGHFRPSFNAFVGDAESYVNVLHNERNNNNTDATIKIEFLADRVKVNRAGTKFELVKGTDFKLHENIKGVFWGGCNVHSVASTWTAITSLFGADIVSVGWSGTTGWTIPHITMGGTVPGADGHPTPAQDFFERLVAAGSRTSVNIKESWLQAAAPINWTSGGTNFADHFNVRYFESSQLKEWGIQNSAVVEIP